MTFDNSIVEKIKESIDIIDLVSEYVNLKKAGQNWKGLCPFHGEKTPSFMVNPSKQIFHCFGCHKGGDIFTFIIEHENVTFPEALHTLAERAGISLEKVNKDDALMGHKALLSTIVHDAAVFYRKKLAANQNIITYLSEQRGVTAQMQEKFFLGYAPPGRSLLYQYLKQKGYSQKDIAHAGLIRLNEERDIFFKRIIFPVFNLSDDIVALGGRVLDSALPKYLNSPETPLFNKSRTLFGLNHARKEIRKKGFAIISEGYFDVIISHQCGFTHTVAPLGTAVTEEQARLLKRYTDTVIMVFDGDEAGLRAARRGFGILLKAGFNAKSLILPDQEDPDSILRKQGPEAYIKLLDRSLSLVDFFLSLKENRQALIREVVEMISQMKDSVLKGAAVQELAQKSGINETFLLEELGVLKKKTRQKPIPQKKTAPFTKRPREEMEILGVILFFPAMLKNIFDLLCLDDFTDNDIQSLISKIPPDAEECSSDQLLSQLMDLVSEGPEKQILSELSMREDLKEETHKRLDECVRTIKRNKHQKELHIILEKIKDAEKKRDYTHMQELLAQRMKLVRERQHV